MACTSERAAPAASSLSLSLSLSVWFRCWRCRRHRLFQQALCIAPDPGTSRARGCRQPHTMSLGHARVLLTPMVSIVCSPTWSNLLCALVRPNDCVSVVQLSLVASEQNREKEKNSLFVCVCEFALSSYYHLPLDYFPLDLNIH